MHWAKEQNSTHKMFARSKKYKLYLGNGFVYDMNNHFVKQLPSNLIEYVATHREEFYKYEGYKKLDKLIEEFN